MSISGTICAEISDQFAFFNVKGDTFDRAFGFVLPGEKTTQSAERSIELAGATEFLDEIFYVDYRHETTS